MPHSQNEIESVFIVFKSTVHQNLLEKFQILEGGWVLEIVWWALERFMSLPESTEQTLGTIMVASKAVVSPQSIVDWAKVESSSFIGVYNIWDLSREMNWNSDVIAWRGNNGWGDRP